MYGKYVLTCLNTASRMGESDAIEPCNLLINNIFLFNPELGAAVGTPDAIPKGKGMKRQMKRQPIQRKEGVSTMEKRILVVDDDQVVGKSFERVLTNKGYRVDTALSGREAFEKYAGGDFDMVFTDLRMPDQDGLKLRAGSRR